MTTLEKATYKSLSKVGRILSGIVSNLSSNPEFNEDKIISEKSQQQLKSANSIIERAVACIRGLHWGGGLATFQLLTAIMAICVPQKISTEEESLSSLTSFYRLLELNRGANM